jgi:uncharacterized surface anchored protein
MSSAARIRKLFICSLLVACFSAAAQTTTATPHCRIAGIVVSKIDGHTLARARVVIGNVKNRQNILSTVTSDDGKFEFTGLAAGKYFLQGDERGYLPGAYDQHEQFSTAIVTGAGIDTQNLILRLSPAAYIIGRVLDENGDPVRRANVSLYRVNRQEGVSQVARVRGATTDDLGAYELGPQDPGTYYVSASATPWYAIHPLTQPANTNESVPGRVDPSLDVVYPITYYSDVIDPDAATPIRVRGGERVQIDIHLNPVQALHLYFHAAVDPQNGLQVPQLSRSGMAGEEGMIGTNVQQVSPGIWEMTGVAPGRYSVRVPVKGAGEAMVRQVDVVNDGQELDTSGAEALSSINIMAHLAAGASLPPRLAVGLRLPHGTIKAWQQFDSKGEAHLPQIPAGRYEVLIWNFGKPYSIAQISSHDVEVYGHMLNVPAGSTVSVSVTVITGMGNVQGFVNRAGKPLAGAMVLLVPKDPTTTPDLFRRDQTDLDGSFQLNSVMPGNYIIVAIQNGWELDWSQPATLAPYILKGQAIEVGDDRTVFLPQVVEAQ